MIILGLVILVVAVAIGVAGVVTNTGTGHMLGDRARLGVSWSGHRRH
ncbi:hypothetical protein [Prescottella agglutinans]